MSIESRLDNTSCVAETLAGQAFRFPPWKAKTLAGAMNGEKGLAFR